MPRARAAVAKKILPLSRVYGLLEPGPVVLLTTVRDGRANVMPLSWHTMMEFEPPTVGCVISARDYTFGTLRATRECVINIPTVELAQVVVKCGNSSGRTVDKFAAFDLTALPASEVEAPLIGQCYACLECRLADDRMVGKYNFFVLEVCQAWIAPGRGDPRTIHHRGRGTFMVAGRTIKLPSKMR